MQEACQFGKMAELRGFWGSQSQRARKWKRRISGISPNNRRACADKNILAPRGRDSGDLAPLAPAALGWMMRPTEDGGIDFMRSDTKPRGVLAALIALAVPAVAQAT